MLADRVDLFTFTDRSGTRQQAYRSASPIILTFPLTERTHAQHLWADYTRAHQLVVLMMLTRH